MKRVLTILFVLFFYGGFSQIFIPQKVYIDNQIIEHGAYIASYNESCEQANWVFYTLDSTDFVGTKYDRPSSFKRDDAVETETASNSDYRNSGYDRGHLMPAADRYYNEEELLETFYYTNVSPQDPSFNRGIWRRLENEVRNMVNEYDSLYVVTGGILSDSLATIGKNEVCVPNMFFKVIYAFKNGNYSVICYLMPNEKSDADLNDYQTTLGELKNVANLHFFIKKF